MKTVLVLLVILFASSNTMAQKSESNDKVVVIEMGVSLVNSINHIKCEKNIPTINKTEVARLYKNKNYRVTRELSFTTKLNSPKAV